MRDDRVRPRVSSRTAWRVRSTSLNPNDARPAAAASALSEPAPASEASSGRKYTRSWMARTTLRWWASSWSNASTGPSTGRPR